MAAKARFQDLKPTKPKYMTTRAYKGYLIKINPLNGEVFIEKEGFLIARPNNEQEAKQTIDELTQ